ncbi:uncharacterized protein NECHADRAFT_82824 [Fusarium vanettenii 77-13-4]|uniref:Mid2 domain-containing protein n=1 Tax=Fusarium vanettenii (strain ATCC MYA-4622 / CBS 123669 / FGSC 9596 / NRRL 45880 / 77-13-4) TaxID=660122 RepID=C7YWY2_FUSV7|nr:uncharacterized protein NECHADRAFT_82824 [Fusarium vanettenii 77-13-4]EEU43492.1 hypothetical protein NECHADRAFT_82824 [Fusarium vanettenii 77-13-4]
MGTLSLLLVLLSGILALENGNVNGGVALAQMPACARRYHAEFKNGITQRFGSSPGRKGFDTNDDDIDVKVGAKINIAADTKTNAYTNAEIIDEFNQLIGNTSTGTQKSTPSPTQARTPVPNSNQSGEGLITGAKAGIGVGVSFGVVGMACLVATLWLRAREKTPPVTPRQEIQDVGKNGLSPPTVQPLQVSEIDGREAPRELPA